MFQVEFDLDLCSGEGTKELWKILNVLNVAMLTELGNFVQLIFYSLWGHFMLYDFARFILILLDLTSRSPRNSVTNVKGIEVCENK